MASESKTFRELGTTGLSRWGGEIYQEPLTQLRGAKANKVYKEMALNDAVVAATLFAIRMLLRRVKWEVRPFSAEEGDQDSAEFLTQCMGDMSHSWTDTLNDILSFLQYGWALVEIVYKKRGGDSRDPTKRSNYSDGKVGWRKLAIRGQTTLVRWEFDEEGGIRGMIQYSLSGQEITIPIEKALLFRSDTSLGNPQGQSILRAAYRSWYFKKTIEEIEGIGVERDLAGLPVVWVPDSVASATTTEAKVAREVFLKLVTNIRRDKQEGILMPLVYDERGNKLYDLELLSAGGNRQFDTEGIIERYSRQIMMSVLADFIMLGHEKVGTYALGMSKVELFATALDAWAQSIQEVFNRYGIPRLWRVNGWNTDRLPEIVPSEVAPPDLETLAKFVATLAGQGAIIPEETLEKFLRERAHLPTTVEEA